MMHRPTLIRHLSRRWLINLDMQMHELSSVKMDKYPFGLSLQRMIWNPWLFPLASGSLFTPIRPIQKLLSQIHTPQRKPEFFGSWSAEEHSWHPAVRSPFCISCRGSPPWHDEKNTWQGWRIGFLRRYAWDHEKTHTLYIHVYTQELSNNSDP